MCDSLLSLEKQDGAVTEVKIYEVFGLVGNEGTEVATDDAVPGRALAFIKLWKEVSRWQIEKVSVRE